MLAIKVKQGYRTTSCHFEPTTHVGANSLDPELVYRLFRGNMINKLNPHEVTTSAKTPGKCSGVRTDVKSLL